MRIELHKKKYNRRIKIYYKENLDSVLAEEVINSIWFNKKGRKIKIALIKADKGKVYKAEYNNQTYYIKSYANRSIKKNFKNIFRLPEGIRFFKLAEKLKKSDIPAPVPVLALTLRRNFIVVDSIFVMEEVAGVDLYTYLSKTDKCNRVIREKVIDEFAFLWSKLINNKFLHQDPGLNNFMIDIKEDIEIKLIDIDNIYQLPVLPERLILKNLAKLRSRQITDFNKTDTKPLSQKEVSAFLVKFKNYCNRIIKSPSFLEDINIEAIRRLIKYNSKDIVFEDENLYNLYQEKMKSSF